MPFVLPELLLLGRVHQLQGERAAAALGVHAQRRWRNAPVGQDHVEHLDVDGADVAAHPVLEDVDEEA
ncbi:hypothetical protein AB0N07_24950 [Streptomyces sp. NPDC051172]|uniref:hypothetical protein n=1 Tax=Streptomyces sp. NPDC051172 TaxID=3155796 RepID=UPI00341C97C9